MTKTRTVVVIGGGLTGLAAAYALEQHQVAYTLIEVKPRLGGSIESVQMGDYIFDAGEMVHQVHDRAMFTAYLAQIGLSDAWMTLDDGRIVFKHGTGVLVEALAARITAPIMSRMAVSTLGLMGDQFAICMENGMLLDARALIIAAPARHTERMFSTLVPIISEKLRYYPYDDVTFVSLGYADAELAKQFQLSPTPGNNAPDVLKDQVLKTYNLPEPQAYHIGRWSESHPVAYKDKQHPQHMAEIQALLPVGVALVGSDYIPTHEQPRLDERIQQGIQAANDIVRYLL